MENIRKKIAKCIIACQLSAIITFGDPIVANETYKVNLRLFDKAAPTKELLVSMNIQVID